MNSAHQEPKIKIFNGIKYQLYAVGPSKSILYKVVMLAKRRGNFDKFRVVSVGRKYTLYIA